MSAPETEPHSSAEYLHTEFLDRIAHDLRGPVGVTSGALDEIEIALGPDAEALRTYLQMARRGMGRVLRIADRLRRTSQLEAGTVRWTKSLVDLRDLTRAVVTETEELEARRRVGVTVSFAAEPCWVMVDADWMGVAIAELVGNAIRFARSTVSVRTESLAEEAVVTIIDDGPGFSGPTTARFTPPSEKRGVGLSMPLARDVIAGHEGRLEVTASHAHDADAKGARVVLLLPIQTKRPA